MYVSVYIHLEPLPGIQVSSWTKNPHQGCSSMNCFCQAVAILECELQLSCIHKCILQLCSKDNEMRITHELKSQRFVITCILTHASSKTRSLWSTVQQSMPKNIFNYSIKYLNNTHTTRKNLSKWAISHSSDAPSALKLKRFNMSSLVVQPTWKRVDIPGVTILYFSIFQKLLHDSSSAHYMPTCLHFYHQALLPGIPLDQLLYWLMILLFIFLS